MIHLTIQQISSYCDGELSPSSADLVRQHLESCEPCAAKLSRLEAQGGELADALRSDPGEAFFDRIAIEIEERIRSGLSGSAEEPATPAPSPAVSVPPRPERKVEPVVESPLPEEEPVVAGAPPARGRFDRPSRGRSGHPARWVTAALVTVIAVSAGVMISNVELRAPGPVGEKPIGPADTRGSAVPPADAQATQPVSTEPAPPAALEEETIEPAPAAPQADRNPSPVPAAAISEAPDVNAPAAGSADSDASDFEPVMTRADQVIGDLPGRVRARTNEASGKLPPGAGTGVAPSTGSGAGPAAPPAASPSRPQTADQYEAAAAYWEEQLAQLRGDDYRAARYRLAEARYHAWQMSPGGDRAAKAEAAIRAYLVTARKGPERTNATRWLASVEEAGFR